MTSERARAVLASCYIAAGLVVLAFSAFAFAFPNAVPGVAQLISGPSRPVDAIIPTGVGSAVNAGSPSGVQPAGAVVQPGGPIDRTGASPVVGRAGTSSGTSGGNTPPPPPTTTTTCVVCRSVVTVPVP